MPSPLSAWFAIPGFNDALRTHIAAAEEFYKIAAEIGGSSCPASAPEHDWRTPERNFFSALFLFVTRNIAVDEKHLPLYAAVNMAMRICVTGCDNLLDDEDKPTFRFDIAAGGAKMRSVLSIMLADRALEEYVRRHYPDKALLTAKSSLRALMSSARQEWEEETRPVPVLTPDEIMSKVHKRKTAELFLAPLALPEKIEEPPPAFINPARRALSDFGLACQTLDDMKDMPHDAVTGRHNLLVSIEAQSHGDLRWLDSLRHEKPNWTAAERFPNATREAAKRAHELFKRSIDLMAESSPVSPAPENFYGLANEIFGLLGVSG